MQTAELNSYTKQELIRLSQLAYDAGEKDLYYKLNADANWVSDMERERMS